MFSLYHFETAACLMINGSYSPFHWKKVCDQFRLFGESSASPTSLVCLLILGGLLKTDRAYFATALLQNVRAKRWFFPLGLGLAFLTYQRYFPGHLSRRGWGYILTMVFPL